MKIIPFAIALKENINSGPYLDTGTFFFILAADQNIFKLQLYNDYGLKVQSEL